MVRNSVEAPNDAAIQETTAEAPQGVREPGQTSKKMCIGYLTREKQKGWCFSLARRVQGLWGQERACTRCACVQAGTGVVASLLGGPWGGAAICHRW